MREFNPRGQIVYSTNMSEQDQHSNENDEKSSTLVGERDSQDEIDFDSLFADNENNDEDTPVTRAELEQWKKVLKSSRLKLDESRRQMPKNRRK